MIQIEMDQGERQERMHILEQARAKNALERCGKFYLADVTTPAEALAHVEERGRDVAEVRPELGHSTNAACTNASRACC